MSLLYDEGLLYAMNSDPIDPQIYQFNSPKLVEYSQANVQSLISRLFHLPVVRENEGLFAMLPEIETALPRGKPIPEPREKSAWEKYAESKGIKARKKDKMVYDEFTDEFRPRAGFGRANDPKNEWLIEGGNVPLGSDPFIEKKHQKQAMIKKNEVAHNRNLKRRKTNQDHIAGDIGLSTLPNKLDAKFMPTRMKKDVSNSYERVRLSTASMGKFDNVVKGEQALTKSRRSVKKEGYKSAEYSKDEAQQQLAIANRVNKVQESKRHKLKDQSTNMFQQLFQNQQQKRKKKFLLAQNKEKYKKWTKKKGKRKTTSAMDIV